MARPTGFEPVTVRLEGGCSIQLSYGRAPGYSYGSKKPLTMRIFVARTAAIDARFTSYSPWFIMNKKPILVFFGVFSVMLAAYAAAWYVLSGQAVARTQEHLAQMGQTTNRAMQITLSAEQVVRTPFPAIGVRLINVQSHFLPAAEAGAKALRIDAAFQGQVDVVTDYPRKQLRTLTDFSSARVTLHQNDTETVYQSEGAVKGAVVLTTRHFNGFQRFAELGSTKDNTKIEDALKAAFAELAGLRMDVAGYRLKDAQGNVFLGSEGGQFHLVNRSTPAQIDFDLAMDFKAIEISSAYYTAMIAAMPQNLVASTPFDMNEMPFSQTRAGKQDTRLDATVTMPTPEGGKAPDNFLLDARTLYLKNNYFTLQMPTHIALSRETHKLSIKQDWSFEVTPAAAAEMQRVIDSTAQLSAKMQALKPGCNAGTPTPDCAPSAPGGMSPELRQKITEALPTLSTLGPITLAMDVETVIPEAAAGGKTDAVAPGIIVRNYDLNHKRWGIGITGNATGEGSTKKMDFTIVCRKCASLTHDLYTTAQQASEALHLAAPEKPLPFTVTQAMLTGVNQLLGQYGKLDTVSGDIRFVISTPQAGDIRINDRPVGEFAMQFMTLFIPQPTEGGALPH